MPSIGLEVAPRYETSYNAKQGVMAGRSDAVYGQLVIEYERKSAFWQIGEHKVDHAAEQLERYAMHESGLANPSRVAGVGIDGEKVFFTRFRPPEHRTVRAPTFL